MQFLYASLSAAALAFSSVAAHAVPVLYTYQNTSGFSLDGINYPNSYHTEHGNTYMFRMYFLADTSQAVTTTSPQYGSVPYLTTIPISSAVVGYGTTPLANITDTLDLQFLHTQHFVRIFDITTNQFVVTIEVESYDNGTTYTGDNNGYIDSGAFYTDLGPLAVTSKYEETYFDTTLNPTNIPIAPPAATTPEPATLAFFGTGTLGLFQMIRRRGRDI